MIRLITSRGADLFRVLTSDAMFYAVKRGRVPGIYSSWSECESQVKGFPNPTFKKFSAYEDALGFISEGGGVFAPAPASDRHSQDNSNKNLQDCKVFSDNAADISANNSQVTVETSSAIHNHCCCVSSLKSEVENMKASLQHVMSVVEKLSVGLTEVTASVSRLEENMSLSSGSHWIPVYAAGIQSGNNKTNRLRFAGNVSGLGSKRSFSTDVKTENSGDDPVKRPKFDYDAEHFTGTKFTDSNGVPVYTDGGCFSNGRNGARAGIGVFWAKNDPDNVSERLPGRPTNNRAEIHAAVRAVKLAKKKGIQNLILHTDSQFLINGITKWIRGWKKNQWKKTTGSPVINQQDFEELDKELKGINVKWVYVRGHSGNPSNEAADILAKQGAEKLEPDNTNV